MQKEFTKINFTCAEKVITIYYQRRRTQFTIDDRATFDKMKGLIKAGDEDAIIDAISKSSYKIAPFSGGKFTINDAGDSIMDVETGTRVHNSLSKTVISWAEEGLPFEPLLKFHRRTLKNPNSASVEELYEFLEKNSIPITSDGCFMAFKKVNRKHGSNEIFVDCHTGRIEQRVGETISMPREKCDADRRRDCSYGLHVAGYDYMDNFSGSVILEVKVDPADVVAVPMDYNFSKMRTCAYTILSAEGTETHKGDYTDKYKPAVGGIDDDENEGNDRDEEEEDNDGAFGELGETDVEIEDTLRNVAFEAMTANGIKAYINKNYGATITTNNKNKKSIIKQANKIVAEKG